MERDEELKQKILETLKDQGYEESPEKILEKTVMKGYGMTEEEKQRRLENASHFVDQLEKADFDFVTGVPDGTLEYIINNLTEREGLKHQQATRESEAVGIAAGGALADKKPVIYMQNSGLLDSLNDVNSLLTEYELPALLVVGFRGAPGEDAPHHFTNGKVMLNILEEIDAYPQILAQSNIDKVVENASQWMEEEQKPAVVLVIKGALK